MSNRPEPEGRGGAPCRTDLITVYVLDDVDQVRAALVELIDEAEGLVVIGSSTSAQVGVGDIVRLRPQVAVVDGRLRDGDGLEICRTLRSEAPDVAIVIVTAAVGVRWGPVEAASAGAAAYVIKRLRGFELLDVLRRVAQARQLADDSRSPD